MMNVNRLLKSVRIPRERLGDLPVTQSYHHLEFIGRRRDVPLSRRKEPRGNNLFLPLITGPL